MDATTVAIDLAKDVFQVAVANRAGRILDRQRFTRRQFERFVDTLVEDTSVIMESCGTSHYWGRRMQARGLRVQLLPVQYVRPYVRRNKTDRADTDALLEAARCGEIRPVPVKTVEQQTLQAIHRVRTQCGRGQHTDARDRLEPCRDWMRAGDLRELAIEAGDLLLETPRESSTGARRYLGRISKRGDVHLRCLLTHGARAVLRVALQLAARAPDRLTRLQQWAVSIATHRGRHKATVAVANKLARIVWAVWHYDVAFEPPPRVA